MSTAAAPVLPEIPPTEAAPAPPPDKPHLPLVFDRKVHCGARSKRTGEPCRQTKGVRTSHPRSGKCWLHGGRSPNGRRFAQHEAAENALAKLEIAASVDPVASLFEAVRVAAWREQGLRMMVIARPALHGPDHQDDQRPDVVAVMHADALDARAKIAKMAIDAGLDERIVRLAEGQGEVIHRILTAALDAAGVAGEARTKAEEAVVRELVAVGPGGDELN
jgi:hypothetical protein